MDEVITPGAIQRALERLQALKKAVSPERTDLQALANQAQREVLSVTLESVRDHLLPR